MGEIGYVFIPDCLQNKDSTIDPVQTGMCAAKRESQSAHSCVAGVVLKMCAIIRIKLLYHSYKKCQ
jgi:hypothetical protein